MATKHLHSITLNHGKVETRESSSRVYEAVVIATATDKQIEFAAEQRAAEEPKHLEHIAQLNADLAEMGCTVDEAKVRFNALKKIWDGPEGCYATQELMRKARGPFPKDEPAEVRTEYNHAVIEAAKVDLKARGILDPYASKYSNIRYLDQAIRDTQVRIERSFVKSLLELAALA